MWIYFRDEIGICGVNTDSGIQFCNNYAYFSSDSEEYRVKIENIVEITM